MTDENREELSTFGFVRECFEKAEMKGVQYLPPSIIELIAGWVEMEFVYLLEKGGGNGHWKIRVDDILKSVI